ncbi:hypothetical protein D3C75_652950 [compost metagenome]
MKTIHNKLVRDLIPQIIEKDNKQATISSLNKKEKIAALKTKLKEEVIECQLANSDNELAEELADVLEIMYELAKCHNYSFEQIEEIRKVKKEQRGGFEKGIYLHDVE